MKKVLVLFCLLIAAKTIAQTSCCSIPITIGTASTEIFAGLTHDKKFVAAHLEPTPFILQNPIGSEIFFSTPDGKDATAYMVKAKKTNKFLFVIHEWWGLNDYIKQEAERLFKSLDSVTVIALDLYDKNVATSRDSAAKYMQAVKTERANAIIDGAIATVNLFAGQIKKKPVIATIGWCFGGGWSMQASLRAKNMARACVMYYGMPEEKQEKIKTLNAPVLFIWPEQDQWITKEVVSKFEANMKTAKKSLETKKYKADHAFANPSNPKYNKEFADDAFKNAIEFFKKHLK